MNDTKDHCWSKVLRRRYGVGAKVPVRGDCWHERRQFFPSMAKEDQGEADRLFGNESSTPIA